MGRGKKSVQTRGRLTGAVKNLNYSEPSAADWPEQACQRLSYDPLVSVRMGQCVAFQLNFSETSTRGGRPVFKKLFSRKKPL